MLSLQSFLREGRVVGLCWEKLKPKGPKGSHPKSSCASLAKLKCPIEDLKNRNGEVWDNSFAHMRATLLPVSAEFLLYWTFIGGSFWIFWLILEKSKALLQDTFQRPPLVEVSTTSKT